LSKRVAINHQIKSSEVRLIDSDGNQLGVVPLGDALKKAQEQNLDLVQVTDKATPPVCKITNYGKYLYKLQKKEKKTQKSSEIKGIRLRFNISDHDMEIRIKKAVQFLNKGDKVKIDMVLRGREKRLSDFAKTKMQKFIDNLNKEVPIKQETLKRGNRGFSVVVIKSN